MNESENNKRPKAVLEIDYIYENMGQIIQSPPIGAPDEVRKNTLNELEKYIASLQNFLSVNDEYWDRIKTLQTLHGQLKKLYDTL